MTTLDPRRVPLYYVFAMTAWIWGFAATDRSLPAVLVFLALVGAGVVQVAAGYATGRYGALALACVPVVLAAAVAGLGSNLWTTVFVLMVFPGAPLIALGVWLRRHWEERNDRSPDGWLYGEEPG